MRPRTGESVSRAAGRQVQAGLLLIVDVRESSCGRGRHEDPGHSCGSESASAHDPIQSHWHVSEAFGPRLSRSRDLRGRVAT
jgi:hypothetical protein